MLTDLLREDVGVVVVITKFVEEGPRLQDKCGQYHLR